MSSPHELVTLSATVNASSGRMFTTMVTAPRETWNQAYGGELVPLAVRELACAQIMKLIIEHARSLGIHERLAWPQVLFYEPRPVESSGDR